MPGNLKTRKRSKAKAARPGRCVRCGCTHNSPCAIGCGWANDDHTLCTACVELEWVALEQLDGALAALDQLAAKVPTQIVESGEIEGFDATPRAVRFVQRELFGRVRLVRQAIGRARRGL